MKRYAFILKDIKAAFLKLPVGSEKKLTQTSV